MNDTVRRAAAVLSLALVIAACGDGDGGTAAPTDAPAASVRIASPDDRATVQGNVATLDVEVTGIRIAKPDDDASGATGHYHVFIDRDPVAAGQPIPREAGIVHSADDPIKIYGLVPGPHRFRVVLGDGNHVRIDDAEAEISLTVAGPSVDASAPATIQSDAALDVDVAVSGVHIVPADRDRPGETAHLHVLVDKEPTPGQSIPKQDGIIHTTETSIAVPGLTPGEHVIWVVAGDGNHVPLDPPVMDRLTVTVG